MAVAVFSLENHNLCSRVNPFLKKKSFVKYLGIKINTMEMFKFFHFPNEPGKETWYICESLK